MPRAAETHHAKNPVSWSLLQSNHSWHHRGPGCEPSDRSSQKISDLATFLPQETLELRCHCDSTAFGSWMSFCLWHQFPAEKKEAPKEMVPKRPRCSPVHRQITSDFHIPRQTLNSFTLHIEHCQSLIIIMAIVVVTIINKSWLPCS